MITPSLYNPFVIDEQYKEDEFKFVDNSTLRLPPLIATDEMKAMQPPFLKDWSGNQLHRRMAYSKPLKKDDNFLAIHGLMSPRGELYACSHGGHTDLCDALGFTNQAELEEAGWVTLTRLSWLVSDKRFIVKRLTSEQWSAIRKWFTANQFPLRHYHLLKENSP